MAAARVAVVGGGLAGLAAAAVLSQQGLVVELFEARRILGGRAASYRDPASGEMVDYCQHVSLACCTNFADFCRRTGIAKHFRRDQQLHFIGPDAQQCDLAESRWLPAPLHLMPALGRLKYLSIAERLSIANVVVRLARSAPRDDLAIGPWLRREGQSERVIDGFWSPVLVSALGESLERSSLRFARKVLVDGFLAARNAWHIDVPAVPLAQLYDTLAAWLARQGVSLHLSQPVAAIIGDGTRASGLQLADGQLLDFDYVVAAVTWRHCAQLISECMHRFIAGIEHWSTIEAASISGIHLWFDRPITPLKHAVLVGRLGQWMFQPAENSAAASAGPHYYQIVVSASQTIAEVDRRRIIERIYDELREIWPAARQARLLRWRVVTDPHAVFSAAPGVDALRPSQRTGISNLMLAGDWTLTGWPATMEGAVRSGYLAAEAVLESLGNPRRLIVDDLPKARLTRWLLSRSASP